MHQYIPNYGSHSMGNPGPQSFQTPRHQPLHKRSYSSSDAFISPLSKIKEEHKNADKLLHIRRAIPPDTIDTLDVSFLGYGPYHHEGPYDATLASRQVPGYAPLDAVKYTNSLALSATPRANIIDSLTRGVPLQGVGMVPPGAVGPGGQVFDYEEDDIMRSQGRLERWHGVEYPDTDMKGQGEQYPPMKEHEKKQKRRSLRGVVFGGGDDSKELYSNTGVRKRSVSDTGRYPYRKTSTETSSRPGTAIIDSLRSRLTVRKRK